MNLAGSFQMYTDATGSGKTVLSAIRAPLMDHPEYCGEEPVSGWAQFKG